MLPLSAAEPGPKREFRAVWLSTVSNIDWPKSKYDSDAKKQSDLKNYLIMLRNSGCNAVLFQVRCSADAMYKSDIEPWSHWFSGTQGTGPVTEWDPLHFAVEEAHKLGMELHAWVNPYRAVVAPTASKLQDPSYISSGHITKTHPEWILKFSDVHILDPGLPEVRDYIRDVLLDIVTRYDIDGLHMDDYFYPYSGIELEDTATFSYDPRGFEDIHDWRRDNINRLVEAVMDSIHDVKPWVKWGISPFGIYKPGVPEGISGMNAYAVLYCDPLAWLQDGSVDYLTPQCYWPFEGGQDYGKLIPWWAQQSAHYGKHFYPGQAMYRAGDSNFPRGEIPRQIRLNRATPACDGSVFFTANDFSDNHKNTIDSLQLDLYRYPALWPVMAWKDSLAPGAPENVLFDVDADGAKTLTWQAPAYADPADSAYGYVIYRAPYHMNDPSDMSAVMDIRLHTDGSFSDTEPGMYYYMITTLDRNKQESRPAEIDYPFVRAVYPAYAAFPVPKDTALVWRSFPGASQYTLEVSPDGDFSSPLYRYLVPDTVKYISTEFQTGYAWRVKADNSSVWSPVWQFDTELQPQVRLVAPFARYEGAELAPELSWRSFAGASGYELELARDASFGEFVLTQTGIADTAYRPDELEPATRYYWRVRSDLYERWSETGAFTTRYEHIERAWVKSMMDVTYPGFFDPRLEGSGLAVGTISGDPLLLVLQTGGDSVRIHALNAHSGEETPFELNLSGVSGGEHILRDIEISEDGVIYASNCVPAGGSFRVYQWTDPALAPVCIYQADDIAWRLGDHITVNGRFDDGSLTVYAPAAKHFKVVKLRMNSLDGSFEAEQISLERTVNTNPCVALIPGSGELYVNSTGNGMRHYTPGGGNISYMKDESVFPFSANAAAGFTYGGRKYIASYSRDTESAIIADVTEGMENALFAGATYRMGTRENGSAAGDVEVLDNGDGSFTLFVLGDQNGVGSYVFDAENVSSLARSADPARTFALGANYPNPFNPVTLLPYTLNEGAHIELFVSDLAGKRVRTIFEGYRPAGSYQVRFDAAGLSSGIYLCTLRSGKQHATRKIMLLK